MKILKYKKISNGRYKLVIEGLNEMQLYEETILKYELLLKKVVDDNLIDDILSYDKECETYYVALKFLKSRARSTKELQDILLKKGMDIYHVNRAINKLLLQGYLNDQSFVKSYINNQIITSTKGPFRIINDLVNKGVEEKVIIQEINCFTEELQIEKINKIIKNLLKNNRSRGGNVLRNKIINDLISLGYDSTIINKVIVDYKFDNDVEIAKKEYEKLYKRYCRKYSGKQLEYKIKEKLYQKGLSYED